jgi:hypothetical protein
VSRRQPTHWTKHITQFLLAPSCWGQQWKLGAHYPELGRTERETNHSPSVAMLMYEALRPVFYTSWRHGVLGHRYKMFTFLWSLGGKEHCIFLGYPRSGPFLQFYPEYGRSYIPPRVKASLTRYRDGNIPWAVLLPGYLLTVVNCGVALQTQSTGIAYMRWCRAVV